MLRTIAVALALGFLVASHHTASAQTRAAHKRSAKRSTATAAKPTPDSRSSPAANPSLLDVTETERHLASESLKAVVSSVLPDTRRRASRDPASARVELKNTLETVTSARGLEESERADLYRQLQEALRLTMRREDELQAAAEEREAARGASEHQRHVLAGIEDRQERVRQLVDRFDALLAEGDLDSANEITAVLPESADSEDEPTSIQPARHLEVTAATRRNKATRLQRQQGLLDTLDAAETAHVAQSDRTPIVYPSASEWQALTARRVKYAKADAYEPSPAEAKIREALAETTTFDFVNEPLSGVIDYLKDLHGIEIVLDRRALVNENYDFEAPVTLRLKGVSLRSALRHLLSQLDLTYSIENEVLLVTTFSEADEHVTTRAYPVADLVVPIPRPRSGGSFGSQGGNSSTTSGANSNNMFSPFGQGTGQNSGQNLPGMGNGMPPGFF